MPQGVDTSLFENYIVEDTVGVHLWDFSWIKFKKERSILSEVIFRTRQLIIDFFSFDYPLYYFNINFIRILRILKLHS
jgi:hypothetical protein